MNRLTRRFWIALAWLLILAFVLAVARHFCITTLSDRDNAPALTNFPINMPTYTAPSVVATVEMVIPTVPPAFEGAQVVTPVPTLPGPLLPRTLYFLSDRDGGTAQVYMLEGDGSPARKLTNESRDVLGYALDPAGEFLVAYTERRVILVYNARRFDSLEANDANLTMRGMALAPDGEHLAIWNDDRLILYEVGLWGQRFLHSVSGEDWQGGGHSVMWNADGAMLAYTTGQGVYSFTLSTASTRQLIDTETPEQRLNTYRVTEAFGADQWMVRITRPNGDCRVEILPDRGEVVPLRCPVVFAPDGRYALWIPADRASLQVAQTAPGIPDDEAAVELARYNGYAASWPSNALFFVWTCGYSGQLCAPGTLDLYRGSWPNGRLTRYWNSQAYRVLPEDGGQAAADPAWESFAVVVQGEGGGESRAIVVVGVEAGVVRETQVRAVIDAGNNWAPQWF